MRRWLRSRLRRPPLASLPASSRGPNDACHAPGHAVVTAMREELIGIAEGAAVGRVDALDAGRAQLQPNRLAEVHVRFAPVAAPQGGLMAKDLHELTCDFRADFEGLFSDARADGGHQVLWSGTREA